MALVSESGLYKFILRAQTSNPKAVEFQNIIGQNLRVVESDGEPWFVTVDVARCIGQDPKHATTYMKAGARTSQDVVIVRKTTTTREVRGLLYTGNVGKVAIVSEATMYAYVLRAQQTNPRVVAFQNIIDGIAIPSEVGITAKTLSDYLFAAGEMSMEAAEILAEAGTIEDAKKAAAASFRWFEQFETITERA